MPIFSGSLNANEVFAGLFNMIISFQMFPTGVEVKNGIYTGRKVDGTLYGDQKLYESTDVLRSYSWNQGSAEYNLLTVKRPPSPKIDYLEIDEFRQIPLTVDNYLTKRAYMNEGDFSSFNAVIMSWLQKTKEVYEHTTYTANILTSAEAKAKNLGTIDLTTSLTDELEIAKWRSQQLYRQIEDAVKELEEPSRDWNDLGFLRTYKMEDFDIIVPLGVLSSVRKLDVPFLYTPDEKPKFKEIHWKYFGAINASGDTTPASNTKIRALVEQVHNDVNYFPGDLLPNSTAYEANKTYTATYESRPSINEDITVLLIHKQDYPIMSAFSVGTSFFNAQTLNTNHYLTFGHSDVYNSHLRERALLKMTTDVAE